METANQPSAFWITGRHSGEIRKVVLPDCAENDVLVRTSYSAISHGTEMLVYGNRVPASERQRMRAPFQDGCFPFPVKYGYSNIGIVEKGPKPLHGQTVFCLFPHQSHYVVPAHAVVCIPDHIPPSRAILAANMETAVNALWDARVHIGDKVSVIGAGVLGCLVAYLAARIAGCQIELIDINTNRKPIAESLGVQFAAPADASHDRDLVIHASGSEGGLNTALTLAGMEATVLEMSWFGTQSVAVHLGEAFHSRRLQLRCSQVGQLPAEQRSRWSHRRRLELAVSLLNDAVLDNLISGESLFHDLPDTLRSMANNGTDTLCHRIKYG